MSVPLPLAVYQIETHDGEVYDWAARSMGDALLQHVEEIYGGSVEGYLLEESPRQIVLRPDEESMTISFPPTSCDPEGRDPETRTLAQWAALRGRGLLCSTVDESR